MSHPAVASVVARIAVACLVLAGAAAVLGGSFGSADVLFASPTAARTAPPTRAAATAAPARSAQAASTPAAFAVTVDEEQLTRSAASGFPQTVSGVTVSDPQVRIETDRVRLVARAKVLFGTTEFVMTATPRVANGRLDVRVDTATLAGFAVPSDTRASIQQTVEATIAAFVPASVNVTSVTLAPGVLTVRGTQR